MSNNYYTENLAEFGARELQLAGELLTASFPDGFSNEGVRIGFNKMSGNVFLVNDDYQVAMFNGNDLELFHTTPYEGHEGFIIDLLDEHNPEDLHYEDAIYIFSQAKSEGAVMPECWLEFSNALEEV
jgi:hypothetical protein